MDGTNFYPQKWENSRTSLLWLTYMVLCFSCIPFGFDNP